MNNVDEKSLEPQKISPLGTFITLTGLSLAVTFSGCQYHYCAATIMDEDGNVLNLTGPEKVKDISDCKYGKDPVNPGNTKVEVKSVEDLDSKMSQITKDLDAGKTVEIKFPDEMATSEAQYRVWDAFGSLRKKYGAKIKFNKHSVVPAKDGQRINHARYTGWEKPTLGVNNNAQGGAKGGAMWTVPSNEMGLFAGDGQGGEILHSGDPEPTRIIEFQNDAELQGMPDQVMAYQGIYEELFSQSTQEFDFTNPGARSLDMLVAMEKQGLHSFHASMSKMGPATDSIYTPNAASAHRLNQMGALKQTTLAGGKYFYLGTMNQASRDTMLSINGLVYRIAEANSDDLPNMAREIPNVVHVNHKMDVRTAFPNQFLNQYKGRVELRPVARPDLPWKEQNVCGVNSAFLDRYECNNPYIPAKQGINGPTLWSQEPIVLGEYYNSIPNPLPGNPDGLDVTVLNFGCDNESGKKIEASFDKTIKKAGTTFRIYKTYSPGRNIPLNIQTNEEKFKDGGKIIADASFLTKQCLASNINGPTADSEKDVVWVENLKIYVGPDMLESYFYWYGLTGFHDAFLGVYGIGCINCDLLVLEMPAGKQCYDWQQGKGGQKSPKGPNNPEVMYQNQKTTFAGFRNMFNGKGSK